MVTRVSRRTACSVPSIKEVELAKKRIKKGQDINFVDYKGRDVYCFAVQAWQPELAELVDS